MKIAVVVGTFAATPYVHLHLEAWRRLYPDTFCMIHDDCSPVRGRLEELCELYGADFASTDRRMPPTLGDLSAVATGLSWAESRGAEVLVKFSRRFIPITDWRPSLRRLVRWSGYHTYSSWSNSYNFGFRSESMAMLVFEWVQYGLPRIREVIRAGRSVFVEAFLHNIAKELPLRVQAVEWDKYVGRRPKDRDGYAPWSWLGDDRHVSTGRFLWHDSHEPRHYANLARLWGLPYTEEDFLDPNMGYGSHPSAVSA